ncbi:uncharacterized protein PAE49_021972 isoform 2-T3 [Odontesthes bonariensis]
MTGYLLLAILIFSPSDCLHEVRVQAVPPPKLTVSRSEITETDSVVLSCEAPSSVSVSQCHFYTLTGGTVRIFSCNQTLTATELLQMARLSSPAEVKVSCYYTAQPGDIKSPHSDHSSINIQSSAVGQPGTDITSLPVTPLEEASSRSLLKTFVVLAGCGVAVGVIFLGFLLVKTQKRAKTVSSRSEAHLRGNVSSNSGLRYTAYIMFLRFFSSVFSFFFIFSPTTKWTQQIKE